MLKYAGCEAIRKAGLQRRLLFVSFGNLLVVTLSGVLLRAFPYLTSFPLHYKNILHGHSHFAFSGWVLPVLLSLTMKHFPLLHDRVPYHHWRNPACLLLLSAYGMLFAFPVQGYGAVSIIFSTLSVVATVYLALLVWKAAESLQQTTSLLFLKGGLLYGCISAIGPFALGPLVAMGKGDSLLYFDAVYFYLHFQYNGLFTFLVLSLLYRVLERKGVAKNGRKVFNLFNVALLPAFALSVLWSEPAMIYHWIGGAAAVLQLAGVFYLLKDVRQMRQARSHLVLQISLAAFVVKNVLQLLSAFPAIALLAFQNRNYVIAYLHLVLLGFTTLFVFSRVVKRNAFSRYGVGLFLFSFVTTESLLVLQASTGFLPFSIPFYGQLLLCCSLFFPAGVGLLWAGVYRKEKRHRCHPLLTLHLQE